MSTGARTTLYGVAATVIGGMATAIVLLVAAAVDALVRRRGSTGAL
jgi:ABC-type Co2+ transport system permease subunit